MSEEIKQEKGMRRLLATALELGPLLLFFAANSKWGIFIGTGVFIVATVASWSFWTIDMGVSFGRKKPLQFEASKLIRPCSCAEARPGKLGERSSDKVAIAFTVLPSTCWIAIAISGHW